MLVTSVIGSERSILSNQSSPVNRRYLWASGNESQMRFFSFFCCSYSVTQSCPTLCNPMDCSTPGFPVLHHFLELSQTHVHSLSDAIQPSHPLSFPSTPAFNLSQHPKILQSFQSNRKEFQIQITFTSAIKTLNNVKTSIIWCSMHNLN